MMEHVRLRTGSTVGIASVLAPGSSTVPMARPSAIKHVTVNVSGGKTAQHPTYLTRILASVRAPIRLVNALIQLKYSIRTPASVSVLGNFGVTMGKCLIPIHVNVSVQLSRVPTAVHHMSTTNTTASVSARIIRQKAAHMDRFGIIPSAVVNAQRC